MATHAELAEWSRAGYGIGALARRYPALDLDVSSEEVRDAIRSVIPDTWVRISKAPRLLLMFDLDGEPVRKRKAYLTDDLTGSEHCVELLCDGQQYVIDGMHPKGYPYKLERDAPLYRVTPEELIDLWEDVVSAMEQLGDVRVSKVSLTAGIGLATKPSDPEELDELLRDMPNDIDDRDEWVQVIASIKGAGGTEDQAVEWSLKWEGSDESSEDEARRVYRSITSPRVGWFELCDRAARSPFPPYRREGEDVREGDDAVSLADNVPETIEFSDDWVALRLQPKIAGKVLWSANDKSWFGWDGKRWSRGDSLALHVTRAALRKLALAWSAFGISLGRDDDGKSKDPGWVKTAAKAMSAAGLRNAREAVKEMIPVAPNDFDRDGWALNTPSGVIDLKTLDVYEHHPGRMMRRITGCSPEEGPAPMFAQFMHDFTGGDKEMESFLCRWAGYCLTGQMSEKALLYCVGAMPNTGKSQFVKILSGIMGGYADSIEVKTLLKSRTPTYNLARLPGVRMVTATEPQQGATWNDSLIKAVTGGDVTEVRPIYGSPFTYHPMWKLLVVGNSEPAVESADRAMLERLIIAPANNQVADERKVKDIAERIVAAEGSAVLHWALLGCLDWQRQGLNPPACARDATAQYAEDADAMGDWIKSHCLVGPDQEDATSDLFNSWTTYCELTGEQRGSMRNFSLQLKARGFEYAKRVMRSSGADKVARGYRGIRLDQTRKVLRPS